jgi:hypothetical protein
MDSVPGAVRRFLIAVSLLLVVVSIAASPLADLRAPAAAMACCAKMHDTCAGVRGPDDCCRHMGHTTPGATPGTVSNPSPLLAPASAVLRPFSAQPAATRPRLLDSVLAFTRPHDPPHLHPYSLLI